MLNANALKRCRRLAEAVNDCCACSVFNYLPVFHGRVTRSTVAGKWRAARESRKFRLNSTSSIARTSSNHSIDCLRTFRWGFRTGFTNLERNVNLKRKRQDKIWWFSWPKRIVLLFNFALVANYARHQNKLRHHWAGQTAKLSRETIKTSTSRLM